MPFDHVFSWTHIQWTKHIPVINEWYISQDASAAFDLLSNSNVSNIEPLPGLETIFEELLREDGYEFIITWSMSIYTEGFVE